MNKCLHPYLAVSSGLFAVVAFLHLLRVHQDWEFQFGPLRIPKAVSLLALSTTVALATWGTVLCLKTRSRH